MLMYTNGQQSLDPPQKKLKPPTVADRFLVGPNYPHLLIFMPFFIPPLECE